MRREDQLWKGIIRSIFPDFIRFIHPGIDEFLDLNRGVEFLDKELDQVYAAEGGKNLVNHVDKLVKVFTHKGEEEWILLHFEVQAIYQKDFSQRMFRYFYRLFDKYNRRISAYAIFTESTPKDRDNIFKIAFLGTNLSYQFNTYKITEATDKELRANENPFAIVVLAARTVFAGRHIQNNQEHDQLMIDLNVEIIQQLLSRNIGHDKTIKILIFLKRYINFKNEESNRTFDNILDNLTSKIANMGIIEMARQMDREDGEIIGENKHIEKVIRNLIINLKYTQEQTAEALELSVYQTKKICRKLAI